MGAYDRLGNLAWMLHKAKDVKDAYEVYEATQSNDALLKVFAKTGELVGIGIPLWFADKLLTKTGLDRVFDSLKKNKSFEQYLWDQAAAYPIFQLRTVGTPLAERAFTSGRARKPR